MDSRIGESIVATIFLWGAVVGVVVLGILALIIWGVYYLISHLQWV